MTDIKPDKEFCEFMCPKERFTPATPEGHIIEKGPYRGQWSPGYYICHHADGVGQHLVTDPDFRICCDVVYDKIPEGADLGLLAYKTIRRT